MTDQSVSRLRDWRASERLSLAAAADLFGLPPSGGASRVKRYEDGSSWPPAQVIEAIERATDGRVTADDIKATRLRWLQRGSVGPSEDTAAMVDVRRAAAPDPARVSEEPTP